MKKIFFLLILFASFSCTKKEVLPPDITQYVTGAYVGFQIDAEGKSFSLPYNGLRASATIAKTGYNKINYTFTMTSSSSLPQKISFDCKLTDAGYNEFNLIEESTEIQVAKVKNGTLINKIIGQNITVYLDKQF